MFERDMKLMLTDYMENGFLENIIDMFKHDASLYVHLPEIMTDERSRVRIGFVNLVETLLDVHRDHILSVIPGLVEHLKDERPEIRADVAYMLEVIGDVRVVPELESAVQVEKIEPVREALVDSLAVLRSRN